MLNNNLNDDTIIWKYLQPYKLKGLLQTSELYLCRADKFLKSDPYEGTFDLHSYSHLKIVEKLFMSPVHKELLGKAFDALYRKVFLNCWCINETESYLMWRAYAPKGFVVKTTIGKLKNSLLKRNKDTNFRIDKINYNSLEELKKLYSVSGPVKQTSNVNPFEELFFRKLDYFKDEKELRILSSTFNLDNNIDKEDLRLSCDLNELIEEIYISPALEDENPDHKKTKEEVETLIHSKLSKKISLSSISQNFIYNTKVSKEDLAKLIPQVIESSHMGSSAKNAKYRLRYNPESGKILGCFPTDTVYKNNNIDENKNEIDGFPFIVVDWSKWRLLGSSTQKYKIDPLKKILIKK